MIREIRNFFLNKVVGLDLGGLELGFLVFNLYINIVFYYYDGNKIML